VLKTDSKCSFIKHKLRFFACFCLASAASKTFFNGLLKPSGCIIGNSKHVLKIVLSGADEHQPEMDHASAKLESPSQQAYHHVRGAHDYPLTHTHRLLTWSNKTGHSS
jgi:hypothetical protein